MGQAVWNVCAGFSHLSPEVGQAVGNVCAGFSNLFPSHGDREGRPDVSTSTMGGPASVCCSLFVVPMIYQVRAAGGGHVEKRSPLPLTQ